MIHIYRPQCNLTTYSEWQLCKASTNSSSNEYLITIFKQFGSKIDLSLIMSDAKARDPRAGLIKTDKMTKFEARPARQRSIPSIYTIILLSFPITQI